MRLTREKINLLSHQVTEKLATIDEVEFIEDRNTIRLAVFDILTKWLKKEETVDAQPARKSNPSSARFPKAAPSGKSFTGSTTRKTRLLWSKRLHAE